MENLSVPTFDLFMNPLLHALRELGGSGTNEEINSKVTAIMGLSDSQLEVIHNPDRSSQTEVEYRLHWARTFLKKYGLIDNSARGVWSLTAKGKEIGQVDPMAVKRFVRAQQHAQRESEAEGDPEEEAGVEVSWKEELLNELLRMDPSAFERLVQRVLRESGFIQVEVTGRSGDGGMTARE